MKELTPLKKSRTKSKPMKMWNIQVTVKQNFRVLGTSRAHAIEQLELNGAMMFSTEFVSKIATRVQ